MCVRVWSGAVLDTAPATSHGSQSRNQFAGIKQTVPSAILPVPAAPLLRVPRVWRHGRVSLIRLLYQPHSPSRSRSRSTSPKQQQSSGSNNNNNNSDSSPAKTLLAFCGVLSYLLLVFLRCHCCCCYCCCCHKGSSAWMCMCACACVYCIGSCIF